jgi:hypothetical protein
MKKILGPALGAMLFAVMSVSAEAQPASSHKAAAVDPASLALAQQILTIAFPPANRSKMYASVMDSIVEQTRKTMDTASLTGDKEFQAILDRSSKRMMDQLRATMDASIPDYFESFARAYARDFSSDDLNAILAFVKTPAGQHYFERAPTLLNDPDVQASNQRMMNQLVAKLPEITRQNMQDVQDYIARKAKEKKTAAPASIG